MDQNCKILWVRTIWVKIRNFEEFFQHCVFLIVRLPVVNILARSNYIWVSKSRKPPKKSHFMDVKSIRKMLKILNFTTTIAMLMKLSKYLYLIEVFNLVKPCGITHWVWEGINKATLWCIILHGITGQNFKQNWIRFRESWPKKLPKSILK